MLKKYVHTLSIEKSAVEAKLFELTQIAETQKEQL
jgi:hypothetical protein